MLYPTYRRGIPWGYNPLILTFDPNKPNETYKNVDLKLYSEIPSVFLNRW